MPGLRLARNVMNDPLHATNYCVSGIAAHAPIDIGSDLSRTMYKTSLTP